jgi:hypothetical protein
MPAHPRIGRIVGPYGLALSIKHGLQDFLVAYIAEVERQDGLEARTIPEPRSYAIGADIDEKRPEHALPSVWVLIPGLDGETTRRSKGFHDATFALAVGAYVTTTNAQDTKLLLDQYARAVRECVLREAPRIIRDSGYGSATVNWTDETYGEGEIRQSRTLGVYVGAFPLTVENVAQAGVSPFPAGPPADPYTPPPGLVTITEADAEIVKEPIVS